ncbi:MAG: hypothetical protein II625_08490 [Bacilli bacterium]|nr:hypothetical protein [Bacilli bacterium]
MKKVLKHLKSNAAIYLVLIACIVVLLIALLYKPKEELKEVDVSLFEVVDLDKAIKLYNDNEAKILIISNNLDQTTVSYVGYIKYSMITNGYKPYFLYQEDIDFKKDKDKVEQFGELLELNVNNNGTSKPLVEWLKEGTVPITVIIKNKKTIYGFIGTLNTSTLDSLAQAYGIGDKNRYMPEE